MAVLAVVEVVVVENVIVDAVVVEISKPIKTYTYLNIS